MSLRVKPEQVVRVISKFIKDREEMRHLTSAAVGVASAKAEADEKTAARLESRNEEEQDYWRRMVQVVPEKQVRVLQLYSLRLITD